MKTDTCFTDAVGYKWTISINAVTIKRLREKLTVDLLDQTGNVFQELYRDLIKLVDTLYVICLPECEKMQVSDVQFGERMVGDHLDEATAAMLRGVANFLGTARGGPLHAAASKAIEIQNGALFQLTEKINFIDVKQAIADAQNETPQPPTVD